jgi:hypothetical protein
MLPTHLFSSTIHSSWCSLSAMGPCLSETEFLSSQVRKTQLTVPVTLSTRTVG